MLHADTDDAAPRRPTGRRPGSPETRSVVLAAARSVFAERGFVGATMRVIAGKAGVDPALLHHYFGSKDQLFLAAIEAPANPDTVLDAAFDGPAGELGTKLVLTLLRVWDGPAGPAALALLRSAVSNERLAAMLPEFLLGHVTGRVAARFGLSDEEARTRSTLVVSQVLGLLMARYVLRVEPLASASPERLAASVGPTVQRYLTSEAPRHEN